jgi:large subunit ribosomal protein L18
MARGPNYHVPFKRRREQKTNYYLRRKLLLSGEKRVVIRPSTKNIVCQVSSAHLKGDKVIAAATSKELAKTFGWPYSTGNLPTAYLVGYLLGKKAIQAGIEGGVADIGLRLHMNRTYGALKGIIDAGMDIPHGEDIFPSEDRLVGKHIEAYAETAGDAESEVKTFQKLVADGVDLGSISKTVASIKAKIDKQYA